MTRTIHTLHVPVIGQYSNYSCGNTCLAAVVQYFGKPYSPMDLEELAKTTSEGTDHASLIIAARKTGATVFEKDHGTLDELAELVSRGLPVIVGWWSMEADSEHFNKDWTLDEKKDRDCGHFSVIRGTTPEGFLFMDPQDGDDEQTIGYCEKPAEEFEAVWYDTDGPKYKKVKRWYMVLNYAGRRFAKDMKGGRDHRPKR